ncbi:MAG: acetylglutamate kinase [Treponema sp.]|nr:acetylglutamate kinase [Treponema sp.]
MLNEINVKDRAQILIQALPYIQQFQNKTMVVKYGGNAMVNEELKAAVIQDVILMSYVGIRTVLVHGGGPEIDLMLQKTGQQSRFINGLRYTDRETMEIVQMVLCGKVNKDIVSLIQRTGGKAIGLCGLDGAMFKARKILSEDFGFVGEIEELDISILHTVLEAGLIPVVSSVACNISEKEKEPLNVNADAVAAQLAGALSAEKLFLITDTSGILRNVNDENSLIKELTRAELHALKKEGIISKGMIPKTDCCIFALDNGVKKACIIDGRLPHSLLLELFTDEGIGTLIRN